VAELYIFLIKIGLLWWKLLFIRTKSDTSLTVSKRNHSETQLKGF